MFAVARSVFQQQRIHVSSRFTRQLRAYATPASTSTVWLKLVPSVATDADVKKVADAYGPVSNATIARLPNGASRTIARVDFKNAADATKFAEDIRSKKATFNGDALATHSAKHESTDVAPETSLFVSQIPYTTTVPELVEHFKQFGAAVAARIAIARDCTSSGYGWVEFENLDEAKKAIESASESVLDGTTINARYSSIPFSCKGYESKYRYLAFSSTKSEEELRKLLEPFKDSIMRIKLVVRDEKPVGGTITVIRTSDALALFEYAKSSPIPIFDKLTIPRDGFKHYIVPKPKLAEETKEKSA